jgi:hypothetical protein
MMTANPEAHLPISNKPKSKLRVKALLGHCLYRRVVIWTIVVIACLSLTLFNPQLNTRSREVLEMVNLGKGEPKEGPEIVTNTGLQKQTGDDEAQAEQVGQDAEVNIIEEENSDESIPTQEKEEGNEKENKDDDGPHWLKYKQ